MPYILRNTQGDVTGWVSRPSNEEGAVNEFVADDNAELLAYINPSITWDTAGVKRQRDWLMVTSDWTQGDLADSDLTVEKVAEWAAYRQLLKDIPTTYATPADVVYPTKPLT